MDEGTDDRRRYLAYSRVTKSKRDFIERWLVNLVVKDCPQYNEFDVTNIDSNRGTFQSETADSTRLDFWDVESHAGKSKKVPKLQFLSTLKNIFRKKRLTHESSVETACNSLTSSSFEVEMSADTFECNSPLMVHNIPTAAMPLVERNPLGRPNACGSQMKKDGETQTEQEFVQVPIERLPTAGRTAAVRCSRPAAFKRCFTRGYSEILQAKGYNCQEQFSELSSVTLSQDVMSKQMSSRTGDVVIVQQCSPVSYSSHILPTSSSRYNKPYISQADSYLKKVELVKRYFQLTTADEQSSQKKRSTTVLKPVPLKYSCYSMCESVAASSAMTKDLTDVPYLREHERMQWQGKNREMWFRISALCNKFRPIDRKVSSEVGKIEPTLPSLPSSKVQRDTVVPVEARRTSLRELKQTMRISEDSTPERADKLEEFFARELIDKNLNDNCAQKLKHLKALYHPNCINKIKDAKKTKAWHEAVEKVRQSMEKLTGGSRIVNGIGHQWSKERYKPPRATRANTTWTQVNVNRQQSKISVTLSTDRDESTTISLTRLDGRVGIKKPLSNIPFTPYFKQQFKPIF